MAINFTELPPEYHKALLSLQGEIIAGIPDGFKDVKAEKSVGGTYNLVVTLDECNNRLTIFGVFNSSRYRMNTIDRKFEQGIFLDQSSLLKYINDWVLRERPKQI